MESLRCKKTQEGHNRDSCRSTGPVSSTLPLARRRLSAIGPLLRGEQGARSWLANQLHWVREQKRVSCWWQQLPRPVHTLSFLSTPRLWLVVTEKGAQIDISPKKTCRWPKAHEKMLNIANYRRSEKQNYNEVPPHTGQNDHHQKVYKKLLERVWRNGNPPTLLVGM